MRREDPALDISLELETYAPAVEAPTTMSDPHALIHCDLFTNRYSCKTPQTDLLIASEGRCCRVNFEHTHTHTVHITR